MRILLQKATGLSDWYQIVRAEHDGREWYEKIEENHYSFYMSERLSPEACIEGTGKELREVADTILRGGSVSFKRCAVHYTKDGYIFTSPRNSRQDVLISHEDAAAFARHAQALLVG